MNAESLPCCVQVGWLSRLRVTWVCLSALMVCSWVTSTHCQTASISVKTIAGGPIQLGGPPFGFADGDSLQSSRFNSPYGLALDGVGNLFVADTTNGAIRKIDIAANSSITVFQGLAAPIDVHFDQSTNFYVLTHGDGRISRYDTFLNFDSIVASNFVGATSFALDAKGNFYVTEIGGRVKKVTGSGVVSVLVEGLHGPRGIEVLDNGLVAISDTEDHAIRLFDPRSGLLSVLAGGNGAGFADGVGGKVKFNKPHGIAKAANGALIVADRMNHRVRIVQTNGVVSTAYGIDPSTWGQCSSCYPGWVDGTNSVSEAREPVGVAVDFGGKMYVSEVYYHLIKLVEGAPIKPVLIVGIGGDGGTNSVTNLVSVAAPSFISTSTGSGPILYGYYPMGTSVVVSSAASAVHYTTDGSEPTRNSPSVSIGSDNTGTIPWRETLRDLTSLRVKAFSGTNSSVAVSGGSAPSNEIGFPNDLVGGGGSVVVVPVVLNLRTNDVFRSLQFRIEVSPETPGAAPISSSFTALAVAPNDFVRLATGDSSVGGRATFGTSAHFSGDTRTLAVSFIGTNSNFAIRNFAVIAMVAIPLPGSAREGDTYKLAIREASGTSDGQQSGASLGLLPDRKLTVSRTSYVVGDSAFALWYNAGSFGDGDLRNDDVNNAFNASLGVRVPFNFSDLFNAMDVFPEDLAGSVGGDGQIRFLDWQALLYRSLRFETNNWIRYWEPGSGRLNKETVLGVGSPLTAGRLDRRLPGAVWVRQAQVASQSFEMISPGTTLGVPVYLKVSDQALVSGMQFRAVVSSVDDGAPIDTHVRFIPATGLPAPIQLSGLPVDQVVCGWNLSTFKPALRGNNLVGELRIKIPWTATKGSCYSIEFVNADGAPDGLTQYDFETFRSCIWVLTKAASSADPLPVEWKARFFGSSRSALADAAGDPDGDGLTNLEEYFAGTDPVAADSKPRLFYEPDPQRSVARLKWLSAPGKRYVIERAVDILSKSWEPVGGSIVGNGDFMGLSDDRFVSGTSFYRLKIIP